MQQLPAALPLAVAALLQHVPLSSGGEQQQLQPLAAPDTSCCRHSSSSSSQSHTTWCPTPPPTTQRRQQQQQQQQQQQLATQAQHILSSHRQRSLLAGLQQAMRQQHQQHPQLQRGLSTAAAAAPDSKQAPPAAAAKPAAQQAAAASSPPTVNPSSTAARAVWRHALPPLHQPSKHVSGTDPLQALRAPTGLQSAAAVAGGAAGDSQVLAAAAEAAAQAEAGGVRGWVRALPIGAAAYRGMQLGVGVTTSFAVYLVVKAILVASVPGALASGDPCAQRLGVGRLRQLLALRRLGLGPDVAADIAAAGLAAQLVALLAPVAHTDPLVVADVCELLQLLLEFGATRQALHEAGLTGVLQALCSSKDVPRGPQEAALKLQSALWRAEGGSMQQQQGAALA